MYGATILGYQLESVARLAIESQLIRSIDFENVIQDFAKLKSRKKIQLKLAKLKRG